MKVTPMFLILVFFEVALIHFAGFLHQNVDNLKMDHPVEHHDTVR
jgi:hypothetical protein